MKLRFILASLFGSLIFTGCMGGEADILNTNNLASEAPRIETLEAPLRVTLYSGSHEATEPNGHIRKVRLRIVDRYIEQNKDSQIHAYPGPMVSGY